MRYFHPMGPIVACLPILLHLTLLSYYSSLATALPFFTNSTAPANLSPACFQAVTSDVAACSPGVGALRKGGYYPQSFLETICTTSCADGLAQFRNAIALSCADDTWTGYEDAGEWSLVLIPDIMIHQFESACLRDGPDGESGRWCNVVGADYAYQLDPQAGHPISGTSAPEPTTSYDECDLCFIKRLRHQAGSQYYDGPKLRSSSVYESRTSSCGITGYPLTTTDIEPTVSISPTTTTTDTGNGGSDTPSACTGTTYEIQPGDTCQSIAISQSIGTAWLLLDNDLTAACADFPTSGSLCIVNICSIHTVTTNDTCDTIAAQHSITLAQLKAWNPVLNSGCYNLPRLVGDQLCISVPGRPYVPPTTTIIAPTAPTTPAPVPIDLADGTNIYCGKYHQAQFGEYCNLIVIKYGITLDNFVFLNQQINANCTNLLAGGSYCIQAVGDINTYSGHPNSPTGGVSLTSITLTQDLATTLPDATWTPPPPLYTELPLAPNTRPECDTLFNGGLFVSASSDVWLSPCELAADTFGVQLDELEMWNPSLGNTSSPACAFDSTYQYCGKYFFGSRPTVTFFELPIKNGTLTYAQGCGLLVDTELYDCTDILDGFNITIAQFHAWNTDVKSDCSGLEEGYQYCVSLDPDFVAPSTTSSAITGTGTDTTTTETTGTQTTEIAQPTGPPGQVQEGQPENCNKWHLVVSGENCGIIENMHFITHTQFILWNPAVSEDCISGFWPNYYYCVGTQDTVSTTRVSSPTVPSTTQTPVPAPDPHQENNAISSCNEYAQALDQDGCWLFADRNGVALADLYAWNAVLGVDGSACGTMLWASYWYCVSVYT